MYNKWAIASTQRQIPAFEWINPARCVGGANIPRRVFIVWYKHRQEPIKLHKLSEVFKNLYSCNRRLIKIYTLQSPIYVCIFTSQSCLMNSVKLLSKSLSILHVFEISDVQSAPIIVRCISYIEGCSWSKAISTCYCLLSVHIHMHNNAHLSQKRTLNSDHWN